MQSHTWVPPNSKKLCAADGEHWSSRAGREQIVCLQSSESLPTARILLSNTHFELPNSGVTNIIDNACIAIHRASARLREAGSLQSLKHA